MFQSFSFTICVVAYLSFIGPKPQPTQAHLAQKAVVVAHGHHSNSSTGRVAARRVFLLVKPNPQKVWWKLPCLITITCFNPLKKSIGTQSFERGTACSNNHSGRRNGSFVASPRMRRITSKVEICTNELGGSVFDTVWFDGLAHDFCIQCLRPHVQRPVVSGAGEQAAMWFHGRLVSFYTPIIWQAPCEYHVRFTLPSIWFTVTLSI